MVQSSFSVSDATTLATVLQEISSGGTDAAVDTAYTITATAGLFAAAETLTLSAGSTLTLQASAPLIIDAFTVTGTVVTDLDFTGTITLAGGVLDNPAIASNSGGTVTAGRYSGAVLGTEGDGGDIAINDGSITSSGTYAAIELDSGTVQNGWNGPATALVSGVPGGVALLTGGLVQNGGTITASGTSSAGVFLGAGTVDNGQLGDTGALISGAENGANITGAGIVDNDGTIAGVASDGVYVGSGAVTNGQLGDSTALIEGGPADNGVWIGAGPGTVAIPGTLANFGTVLGGGAAGVYLQGGGTVNNGAASDTAALIGGALEGALFAGAGSLFNYGTVQANGVGETSSVIGAFLASGGTVENLASTAAIDGLQWGVVVEGAAGFVSNLGSIAASAVNGLGVDLSAGGTLINGLTAGSTATISGGFDGVRISADVSGGGADVQNDGTIVGGVGVDFQSGEVPAAGTLTDDGLIESTLGASGYSVIFGEGAEKLVLQPGGTLVGNVLGGEVAGSTTTLELASGTEGALSALGADTGTVTDGAGSFGYDAIGTIALDAGATWTLSAPETLDTLDNAGSLVLSGGAVSVTGTLLNSGTIATGANTLTLDSTLISGGTSTGNIVIGSGGALTLQAGADSLQTLQFATAGSLEMLALASPISVQATIDGFAVGRTIDLLNTTVTGFQYSGNTLDVLNNSATVAVFDLPGPFFTNSFTHSPDLGTGTFITTGVVCFLAGTMVTTPAGEERVEQLKVGDMILTASGQARPIVWIGVGHVLATRGRRNAATPVIVRKGALAPNVPHYDLRVTKGHSFLLDGVLIPVEFLVNHRSILWDDRAGEVSIYHIELETHDVLLANGAPAESYRDDGNRWLFRNTNLGWNLRPQPSCAPVLTGGPIVDATWRRLLDRVGPRPHVPLTDDPDLHVLADGVRLDAATRQGDVYVFDLPATPASTRVMSHAAAPQELGLARDPRCLGVALRRIVVRAGSRFRVIEAKDGLLRQGFHAFEPANGLRWTDGDALLPAEIFDGFAGPKELVLHLAGTTPYVDAGTAEYATAAPAAARRAAA
jgi:hypothetical protein